MISFEQRQTGWFYLMLLFPLLMTIGFSEQDDARVTPKLSVRPPGLNGYVRYGRWAPLSVELRLNRDPSFRFSGRIEVQGGKGFTLRQPVTMNSDVEHRRITLPVYCASGFPVFTVSLQYKNGSELQRKQVRTSRVLSQEKAVVGWSDELSADRRPFQNNDRVQLVVASRENLLDIRSWVGLLDVIYLRTLPESNRGAGIELRQFDPDASVDPVSPPVVRTNPVDPQVYDVFERPRVSFRKQSWLRVGGWLQLFVLSALLFLCFRFGSSRWIWGLIVLFPVSLTALVYSWNPENPEQIHQVVSFQYHRKEGAHGVREQRTGLFPYRPMYRRTGKQASERNESGQRENIRFLSFQPESLKQSMPVFHREGTMDQRFPALRRMKDSWTYHWDSFPVNGYFVFQSFQPRLPSPVQLSWSESGSTLILKNRSEQRISNLWLHHDGRFYSAGTIPGRSKWTLQRAEQKGVASRERFIQSMFGTSSRRQRILKNWLEYQLDRYNPEGTYVIGLLEREERDQEPESADHETKTYDEILLYQLGDGR